MSSNPSFSGVVWSDVDSVPSRGTRRDRGGRDTSSKKTGSKPRVRTVVLEPPFDPFLIRRYSGLRPRDTTYKPSRVLEVECGSGTSGRLPSRHYTLQSRRPGRYHTTRLDGICGWGCGPVQYGCLCPGPLWSSVRVRWNLEIDGDFSKRPWGLVDRNSSTVL